MIRYRGTALLAFVIFFAVLLFILSSSSGAEPLAKGISEAAKYRPKLPSALSNIYHPSRPTAHVPPEEQKNSTSGESKWYSDWTWLLPFSSSITLDENRSVLPPLPNRPAVYTYYDPSAQPDPKEQDADARLLLTWRKAWWAQGFRPVILGPGEAMNNQLYEAVQKLTLNSELEHEFFRWLAWGSMGSGLFADWHCFPMASYNDELLSYLRRGALPTYITRFDNLESGLFAGEKVRINDAVKDAINKVNDKSSSILDLIPPTYFKIEESSSLAFYSSSVIAKEYPALAERIVQSPIEGQKALAEMVNSHLHATFKNTFYSGIAILKPFPEHTSALVEPTIRLATALTRCAKSSMPPSCPPNRQNCRPCQDGDILITEPSAYKNASHLFTIGTLPHPYTLISLVQESEEVTTRQIRRKTERDPWSTAVTANLLGSEIAGSSRLSALKNLVAGDATVGNSIWLTVESLPSQDSLPSDLLDELEWRLGFQIPRAEPKSSPAKATVKTFKQPNVSKMGIEKEYDLIDKARQVLKNKGTNRINIKNVAEAWNLADTEIWRFVRAYWARSVMERKKWEEEEEKFVGAKLEGS